MSRRRKRVGVSLDPGNISYLPYDEIRMILRGADELINSGGRNMLVKLLKGSKDKKVLEHHLDECPAYGFYQLLTMNEIAKRVDWMIKEDYIRIEYNGRLPMIVFSEKGWEIEEETFAEELYQRFCDELKSGKREIIQEMQNVNRQVVMDVLEKIRVGKNQDFIPMLEEWKSKEVRKVRQKISSVQRSLRDPSAAPELIYGRAGGKSANEISELITKTIREIYPRYYPDGVVEFFCMLHSKERIRMDIQEGNMRVLRMNGRIIGTGCLEGNHITRVYVLPEFQNKGYGTRMMLELEKEITEKYDSVVLDASLPACLLYEKLGYKTVRHERINIIDNVIFVYDVMEKKCRK